MLVVSLLAGGTGKEGRHNTPAHSALPLASTRCCCRAENVAACLGKQRVVKRAITKALFRAWRLRQSVQTFFADTMARNTLDEQRV